MQVKRREHRGRFKATAANGRVYVVDVVANIIAVPTRGGSIEAVGGIDLKTTEGYTVNHLGGDRFEVVDLRDPSPDNTPVTPDDPTIARLWGE